MKKITIKLMTVAIGLVIMAGSLTGCKSKPKDTDLKAAIETLLQTKPSAVNTSVSVDKGVVTLSGQVADEVSKEDLGKITAGISGVKSVVNNLNIASPPPVTISMDDPLTAAVKDATKDFPTVTATVSEGIITLKGEIQKSNLQKLMMSLQALKPKKVDNTQLVIK